MARVPHTPPWQSGLFNCAPAPFTDPFNSIPLQRLYLIRPCPKSCSHTPSESRHAEFASRILRVRAFGAPLVEFDTPTHAPNPVPILRVSPDTQNLRPDSPQRRAFGAPLVEFDTPPHAINPVPILRVSPDTQNLRPEFSPAPLVEFDAPTHAPNPVPILRVSPDAMFLRPEFRFPTSQRPDTDCVSRICVPNLRPDFTKTRHRLCVPNLFRVPYELALHTPHS